MTGIPLENASSFCCDLVPSLTHLQPNFLSKFQRKSVDWHLYMMKKLVGNEVKKIHINWKDCNCYTVTFVWNRPSKLKYGECQRFIISKIFKLIITQLFHIFYVCGSSKFFSSLDSILEWNLKVKHVPQPYSLIPIKSLVWTVLE